MIIHLGMRECCHVHAIAVMHALDVCCLARMRWICVALLSTLLDRAGVPLLSEQPLRPTRGRAATSKAGSVSTPRWLQV
jgi:hypothetical protein